MLRNQRSVRFRAQLCGAVAADSRLGPGVQAGSGAVSRVEGLGTAGRHQESTRPLLPRDFRQRSFDSGPARFQVDHRHEETAEGAVRTRTSSRRGRTTRSSRSGSNCRKAAIAAACWACPRCWRFRRTRSAPARCFAANGCSRRSSGLRRLRLRRTCRSSKNRRPAQRPRRCGSGSRSTVPTRRARVVTAASTRSGLRWRTTMCWAAGGRKKPASRSTPRANCPTARRSKVPISSRPL